MLTNSVPQNFQKFLKSLWQSENVFFIVLFWEFYYKKSNFQAYFPSQPSLQGQDVVKVMLMYIESGIL